MNSVQKFSSVSHNFPLSVCLCVYFEELFFQNETKQEKDCVLWIYDICAQGNASMKQKLFFFRRICFVFCLPMVDLLSILLENQKWFTENEIFIRKCWFHVRLECKFMKLSLSPFQSLTHTPFEVSKLKSKLNWTANFVIFFAFCLPSVWLRNRTIGSDQMSM